MTVRSEIETRLRDWAAAQVPPIPIAYENASFTKPTSGCYLEIFFLGENRLNRNLSADVRKLGMFQITCCAPLNTGMGKVEALAENIVNLFPVLPKTGTVSIEAPLNWSGSYEDEAFICVPVRGQYRVEV